MTAFSLHSYGFGLASKNNKGEIIEVYYPHPHFAPPDVLAAALFAHSDLEPGSNGVQELDNHQRAGLESALLAAGQAQSAKQLAELHDAEQTLILCVLSQDQAPTQVAEAYLKLHLISHRLARPHSLNLDGMFGVLVNLAWTNQGPIDLDDLPDRQLAARKAGEPLSVSCVDKFPKMTDYVVPRGVRIADTARVRLGAYIGEGTTVMHEGFVNFNAGTLGAAMVEGRISAGVVVGENSDLGGGCSTMGTLSGGGMQIISVGKNCLIGANAGIGFPLADGCIVEAGLYVTAGTKVNLMDGDGGLIETSKAMDLSSLENHLFRRNSLSGAVECVPLKSSISLNEDLHSHN